MPTFFRISSFSILDLWYGSLDKFITANLSVGDLESGKLHKFNAYLKARLS